MHLTVFGQVEDHNTKSADWIAPVSRFCLSLSFLEDASWDNAVSNEITYDSCNYKTYAEESCKSVAEQHKSFLPYLVAPTDCLECAPETVCKVEPESCEPYDVDEYHPDVTECELHESVY